MESKNNIQKENKEASSIAAVGRSFTKEEVISILENRANNSFKYQKYERNEMMKCIDIINRLMPPSDFPDW